MAIAFVNQGSAVLNVAGTSLSVTIPSTASGNDLVVVVSISIDGVEISPPASTVSNVTAAGASFFRRVSKLDAINSTVRVEMWSASAVSAGITSVTVTLSTLANMTAAVSEYSGVSVLGTTNTNSATTANPSVALTTQDNNNFVVGGFATASPVAYTALTGNLRTAPVASAADNSDTAGALTDNTAATPSSVTNAVTHGASGAWCAVALELRLLATVVSQSLIAEDSAFFGNETSW